MQIFCNKNLKVLTCKNRALIKLENQEFNNNLIKGIKFYNHKSTNFPINIPLLQLGPRQVKQILYSNLVVIIRINFKHRDNRYLIKFKLLTVRDR